MSYSLLCRGRLRLLCPQNCPGHDFDLALAGNRPVLPERRGVTLGMKGGVEIVFEGQRTVGAPALV